MPYTRTPGPGEARLRTALASVGRVEGQVGWFSSSVYATGIPVAYVAAIQEFGYEPKNIPPRLGLRQMAKTEATGQWQRAAVFAAKAMMSGQYTYDMALGFIGGVAEGSIRKQIKSVWEPPLLEATILARARKYATPDITSSLGKPEVDTGYMLASVTHLVAAKGAT